MDEPRAATNTPEYTVTEISGAVKSTLETQFGRIRVRGEVTEMKRYPSGHIYFSLKDEGGKLAAVAWKSVVPRLGMVPENGVEVIATGKISAYSDRSSYQLMVDRLEYAGAGALLARIEALRVKLAGEGLFDAARKRALPGLPTVIGVITSEQGAVIQDIRTTLLRRFPRTLLLWPVPVQGEGAAEKIVAAIRGFDALVDTDEIPRPDVLIVARGGGSLEDLMAFNDEGVLRAVAACSIPLISAVGHETDTTLIDFVSDRRAPTPTAAAEMAIPARGDLLADLAQVSARLLGAVRRVSQERRLRLSRAERGLPDLPALVGTARQRLDDRWERLRLALPNLLAARRAALARAERGMPDLPALVRARRDALLLAGTRLAGALRQSVAGTHNRANRTLMRLTPALLQAGLREPRARLEGVAARLESVSPEAVLKRGYALVFDAGGHPLTSAEAVPKGAIIRVRFADGEVRSVTEGKREPDVQGALPL
ncbi:MAG: exodeoxyribonuclease VII large subunit [Acetobacteraceae bacterium]|nr:exodeoxyribonuclease VII large subunit [Acetobacteraceae bacterium]